MNEIVIYTNEQCPYCKQVKEELDKNKIKYINKLTSEFKDEWREVADLTGIPQVPTLFFKNNYFAPGRDFGNQQHLINLIKEFKESNINYDRLAFEKVKTLSYNINMAFGKLDQLLRQIETKIK
jgi:glutaredoxin